MDVFSGGKIHHGVGAPFGGPTHLLHFLIDGRSDGGVADVGVDLHEEIAPDNHGLEFRVVDIAGNDGAATGDLGANKLCGDELGNLGSVSLAGMLVIHHIARDLLKGVDLTRARHFVTFGSGVLLTNEFLNGIGSVIGEFVESGVAIVNGFKLFQAPVIFANGDVFHFRSDDALIGIPFLRDRLAGGAERLALQARVFLELVFGGFVLVVFFGVRFGEVSVVDRFDFTAFVFFDIIAGEDPITTQSRETLSDVAIEIGIAPRSGAIVNANGWVLFDPSVGMFGIGKTNFPHGDFERGVNFSVNVDPGGIGEDGGVFFDGGELGGIVDVFDEIAGVVAALLGIFGRDAVFVWRNHGRLLLK